MSTTVENVLKEDKNLSAGDIANIAKFINDLNFALIEKYGVDFKPSKFSLLTNGPLEVLNIPLNYHDGDTIIDSDSIKKLISTYQDGLWHVAQNNQNFTSQRKVA